MTEESQYVSKIRIILSSVSCIVDDLLLIMEQLMWILLQIRPHMDSTLLLKVKKVYFIHKLRQYEDKNDQETGNWNY